jgi:hypothetical protein
MRDSTDGARTHAASGGDGNSIHGLARCFFGLIGIRHLHGNRARKVRLGSCSDCGFIKCISTTCGIKTMELQPITYAEASVFIKTHHRHHLPPQGWKFGIACNDGEKIVGVITVGRPVARMYDDGWTLEVTRCCTDGTKNACSMLYGAARRAAWALGYKRLVTYILRSESGASLKASGYKLIGQAGGGSWSRDGRPRVDTAPTDQKQLFEAIV